MVEKIKKFIEKHTLIPSHSLIVVGLSGGPDSVVLLHILAQVQQELQCTLIAAHLDHEWRQNSGQDAHFCQEFAASLNIPCITQKTSQLHHSARFNGSQEEYGRKLRRAFFEQVQQEYGATHIALGHHRSDQEETFFLRLIRGTTLSGLTGIKPQQGPYIRPLLGVSKEEILSYAHEHLLSYCHDYTNNERKYLRNKLRLDVLPQLRASDTRFSENMDRTVSHLQETEQFLQRLTAQTFAGLIKKEQRPYHLARHSFLGLDPFMQYRILLHWLIAEQVPFVPTQAFLHEIMRFLHHSKQGSHQLHPNWSIEKKGSCILIVRN